MSSMKELKLSRVPDKAKPILFNTDMVQRLQFGKKTTTRRIIKGISALYDFEEISEGAVYFTINRYGEEVEHSLPGLYASFVGDYGADGPGQDYTLIKAPYNPGDLLYVRETWRKTTYPPIFTTTDGESPYKPVSEWFEYHYKALEDPHGRQKDILWKPSIHMPKEAARILLVVNNVRVEQIQDIDEEGVIREGFSSREEFQEYWDRLTRKQFKAHWLCNPWVWVIDFCRIWG